MWNTPNTAVFLKELIWPPKSRSGAPLGSLSDLLKGLAPSSRNANQPTRPNLTSSILPTPARALPKSTITLEAALTEARHQLFISHPPSSGNRTPPISSRYWCRGPDLWPWPQGLYCSGCSSTGLLQEVPSPDPVTSGAWTDTFSRSYLFRVAPYEDSGPATTWGSAPTAFLPAQCWVSG